MRNKHTYSMADVEYDDDEMTEAMEGAEEQEAAYWREREYRERPPTTEPRGDRDLAEARWVMSPAWKEAEREAQLANDNDRLNYLLALKRKHKYTIRELREEDRQQEFIEQYRVASDVPALAQKMSDLPFTPETKMTNFFHDAAGNLDLRMPQTAAEALPLRPIRNFADEINYLYSVQRHSAHQQVGDYYEVKQSLNDWRDMYTHGYWMSPYMLEALTRVSSHGFLGSGSSEHGRTMIERVLANPLTGVHLPRIQRLYAATIERHTLFPRVVEAMQVQNAFAEGTGVHDIFRQPWLLYDLFNTLDMRVILNMLQYDPDIGEKYEETRAEWEKRFPRPK